MDVSVIIPTYNRPDSLRACLNSLKEQHFGDDWEVIVVDDGGKEDLTILAGEFEESLNLSVIRQDNEGPAAARNRGVQSARGEYVAFLDDDCEPDIDWLAKLYSNSGNRVMAGGKTGNKLTNNPFSEASQQLVSFLYREWEGTPWYFFTSNNFMLQRRIFLDIGGFDEKFPTSAGEDREFCARFQARGNTLYHVSNAIVKHAHSMTFRGFWRQHFNYGNAAVQCRKQLLELGFTLPKARLGFYIRMILFSWRQNHLNFVRKPAIIGLILVSQLATCAGYLAERRSNGQF